MTNKTNLKSLDILMFDILFDFTNNAYQQYRKPNNKLVYINSILNHPPTILKELPKSINRWISDISCKNYHFKEVKHIYLRGLNNSDFNTKLVYGKNTTQSQDSPESQNNQKRWRICNHVHNILILLDGWANFPFITRWTKRDF